MDYRELTISMPKEKVDSISTFLVAEGFDTFQICDLADVIEDAEKTFSDYIEDDILKNKNAPPEIKFYCETNSDLPERISSYILGVAKNLGWRDVFCNIKDVVGSDCDIKWKKYFFPFPVGDKLFIKPSWEEVSEEETRGRKIIEIDPAAAFGSGTHATTRLCLEALEKVIKKNDKVLDMGAGSGILGIGALLLGAESLEAVDIDEAAVKTCEENFLKNSLSKEKWKTFCGNVIEDEILSNEISDDNDIILANIVAGVICLMSDLLYKKLKKGGTLIASGILSERKEEVKKTLISSGFTLINEETLDEWVCLEMQKR